MEEKLSQSDEYGFGIVQAAAVTLIHGHADNGGRSGSGDREEHPPDADASPGDGLPRRTDRHEAHNDVRLSEIPQAPGQRTDNADDRGCRSDHCPVVRVNRTDSINSRGDAAEMDDTDDRDGDERRHHHEALDEIRVGHGQESAHKRVHDGDARDERQTQPIVHAEGGLEEGTARDHAGGDVEGEEHQDDRTTGPAQQMQRIMETIVEETRDGDRVGGDLGVGAQARRHEAPVEPGSHGQADGDP